MRISQMIRKLTKVLEKEGDLKIVDGSATSDRSNHYYDVNYLYVFYPSVRGGYGDKPKKGEKKMLELLAD